MADANSGLPRERNWLFVDRRAAGRLLAPLLARYAHQPNVVVLGLPRGGIPVAFEVAVALNAPLDIFAVRKLGVPAQEELAMGAIGSGGTFVINREVMRDLQISRAELLRIMERERRELERREHAYRGRRPYPVLTGKTVILIDDGMATGASMLVAVRALRKNHPANIVIAVPVAPPRTCSLLEEYARVVCCTMPEPFGGVGVWYDEFSQTSDEEVCALLEEAATRAVGA